MTPDVLRESCQNLVFKKSFSLFLLYNFDKWQWCGDKTTKDLFILFLTVYDKTYFKPFYFQFM